MSSFISVVFPKLVKKRQENVAFQLVLTDEKAVVVFPVLDVSPRPTRSGLKKDWTDSKNPCDPRSNASARSDGWLSRSLKMPCFAPVLIQVLVSNVSRF